MESNCASWQKGNVAARREIIIEVLASLQVGKKERLKVTELAETICRTIRAVEIRQVETTGKKYRPINNSTLLRPGGFYRPLLDAFLTDNGLRSADPESNISDPVARRLLISKNLRIQNVSSKLERALKKIEYLDSKELNLVAPVTPCQAEVDALGVAAVALFDMLIGTGLFKLDEETGDVLYITRSRKVAIPRLQIAPFLNWRKRQSNTPSVS
ncbi:hypothetical protein [Pseudomonas viridiflava]|uniref:hypothetical protein n=1 Tax=Pseudomonas viridiflava TaxID=33069 RepID=UPI000F04D385|nr:hypothetical protein [Pseudomonas viridiflava]